VRAVEILRSPANDANLPAAFVNGFTDGQAARGRSASLTAYLRVGIDDYARGYRAGFFARGTAGSLVEHKAARQVVNL